MRGKRSGDRPLHEMGIAEAIVRAVTTEAARRGAERVRSIDLDVASREGLTVEAITSAFEIAAQGTNAEGAVLRVEVLPETTAPSSLGWVVRHATMDLPDP